MAVIDRGRVRILRRAKSRCLREESPMTTDEAPAAVSGVLDARCGQAFLRTSGYRRGPDDVYVPASCLLRFGLRTGDRVEGTAQPRRPSRDDKPTRQVRTQGTRTVLRGVDAVNGIEPKLAARRPEFDELTP